MRRKLHFYFFTLLSCDRATLHRTGRIILIKAILTQAILYGSNPDNPLCFSFPPEVDEEALMAGAEGLSRAVLESGMYSLFSPSFCRC